ncbi:MAG: hypothetical protein U5O39_07715 [Gammaproteobacteria bacterium]|nr:hypothetical protein [Gammaproteobacteria bacterium]
MSAEARAAQDALIEAGINLQKAGKAVANASSEADLQRAREILADARVNVIVASQDLMEAKEAAGDPDGAGGAGNGEFEEAEAALNQATVAIVTATGAIEGMPEFEDIRDRPVTLPATPETWTTNSRDRSATSIKKS